MHPSDVSSVSEIEQEAENSSDGDDDYECCNDDGDAIKGVHANTTAMVKM
jgi:hypothetical protein